MADKKASGIQYDDFVNAIRSDPAQSEPLIMLSGYVGKSDTDGNVRIYPDASLSNWYEASQDDVVHSRPLADSPLGGSHVWLKGTARITPGVASLPKPEPKEGEEGEKDDSAPQVGADTGVFNPLTTIHPTLWTQVGCITQPPFCGPGTVHPTLLTQIGCVTQHPGCGPTTIHPTIWTQIGCSTQAGCIETVSCLPQQGLGAQAQHISLPGCVHTGLCISQPGCLPPHTVGCPVLSVPGCLPPTQMPGCPRTSTCPPATLMLGCLPTSTCPPPTLMPGCPNTRTCTPGGYDQVQTFQTFGGCPTLGFTCTYVACPGGGGAVAEAAHISLPGCIHTGHCLLSHNCPPPPTNMPGCPNTSTCTPGGYGTEAAHISLPGCIHTGSCLLSHNCPPPPTNMPGCPNTGTCTPGGGFAAEAMPNTTATLCTQFGCVTHHPGCGPEALPQTAATVCTQYGCGPQAQAFPRTVDTLCTQLGCVPTHMPGCPSTSTCPPGNTAATLCTHALGCPSTSTCPPQRTIATVCTRYDCPPTQAIGCFPTVSGACLPITMGGCY